MLDAEKMLSSIAESGKVALYGVPGSWLSEKTRPEAPVFA
jgi:hypothetical protein